MPGAVGTVQTIGTRRARGLDDSGVFLLEFFLAVLHRLSQLIVDDAELGNLGDDPLLSRVYS